MASPSSALNSSPDIVVRAFAGSGAAGFADGLPGSFIMPFGVAYAPDGTLYVSDAGAQRIRAVDRSGRVRTIAGGGTLVPDGLWVAGGYRDAAGTQARFNRPAGIVWSNGALYVADTNNHCIRVVTPSGDVKTFAGSTQAGTSDGPLESARFLKPTAMAADHEGNLYVADYFAIRVIHDGQVKTIPSLGNTPFGVAVVDTPAGPDVFVADLYGLSRRDPAGKIERFATTESIGTGNRNIEGIQPLGHPFALAAFDANSIVYGDVRGNSVRYLNWDAGAEQLLGGLDVYDGAATSAGSRDGRGDVVRWDSPTGIAIGPSGSIAVADAASRRIRIVTDLDRTHDAHPETGIPPASKPSTAYRVAFVGNSYLWEYDHWGDSIPGMVESRLMRDPSLTATKRRLEVTPYIFPGAPIIAQAEYVRVVLARTHAADLIVLSVGTTSLFGSPGVPLRPTMAQIVAAEPSWTKELTDGLRSSNEALKEQGVRFVVVTAPLPENLSPVESLWRRLLSEDGQLEPSSQIGVAMNDAVRSSGVPYVDGWAVFGSESRSADHVALFGSEDEHFSPHGREIIANAVADYLRTTKPWLK